jgi:hypothetical protein
LARAIHDAGTHAAFISTGTPEGAREWLADPAAFDHVAKAVSTVIEAFRPAGKIAPLRTGDDEKDERFAHLGELVAAGMLEAVKNPDRGGGIGEWAAPIRTLLGEATKDIRVDDDVVMISAMSPAGNQPSVLATLKKAKTGRSS